jgi:ATP-dependent exoDNAse (exonuclease V) beta subunit
MSRLDNKQNRINLHKLVCLSNLLVENLDDLKVTTDRMLTLKNTLTQFVEELNDSLAETETMQKTTYFNDISNKIDTILRKNFDERY